MAKHHTFFGKIFGWIGDLFARANEDFLNAAVKITQFVKEALKSKAVDFINAAIPGHLDDDITNFLKAKIPVLLADELIIQQAGDLTTEEDVKGLEVKLLDSFGGLDDEKKEKFYTSVAAKIYIFLQAHKNGKKVTFGEGAYLVEGAYQSWLESQQKENG